ncbi:MAG TPA: hypothetical protein VFE18_16310 [Phenylobacterium sp.]|jgi:hypothetical protein|uniref:hypothetical protein n=1 Tax=Phenylobacterium sp. TaxID=1871053 RepID=UPI002D66E051|nr:hypothetical protein [Phenylobacterium sp.]HZZ69737.1 hypothetical protein [Phenylobacterium sp.]
MKTVLLTCAILSVATAATARPAAKTAPRAPADPTATTDVEGLTVTPVAQCLDPKPDPDAPAPRVVSTYPADGAVIRPGVLVVRVTFNTPMSCKGFFSGVPPFHNPCPDRQQNWTLSFNRMSIRTVCRADANLEYGVAISDRSENRFISLANKPLEPYAFRFSVSSESEVRTIRESLAEDDALQAAAQAASRPQLTPVRVKALNGKPQ